MARYLELLSQLRCVGMCLCQRLPRRLHFLLGGCSKLLRIEASLALGPCSILGTLERILHKHGGSPCA